MTFTIDSSLIDASLTISYPIHTHLRYTHSPRFRQRTVRIVKVRDLLIDPLSVQEFRQRPYVRRTRYLALAQEDRRYRQFYLGSTAEAWSPSQLRLALYRESKLIELLARPFNDDVREMKLLLRILERWANKDFGPDLSLRIFADNLRLVG